jgi:translation initiation factor 5B
MASGAIAAATLPQEATKRSKRVYDDRKKKPRPKDPTGTDSEQTTSTGVKAAAQVAATASDSTKTVAAASDARVAAVPDSFEAHLTDAFSDSGSEEDEHALSLASESGVDDDAEQKEAISGKVRFSEPARVQPSGPALSAEERRQLAVRQRLADEAAARTAASAERLRSPIICILGHVDTGKTKLLDKIRHTHVQEGEAGGITQQIGATYFPIEAVRQEAAKVNPELTYRIPSLLIIDTPGHESFTNLRSRGSSLCDIAILVVDIMHGLEQQTLESIELLKMRKTPFIVALNKVDRLYGWKPCPMAPIRQALEENPSTAAEFERRVRETKTAFAEIGFNAELYWENTDYRRNLSLVPTSAISGEGIPDLLMLLVQLPQRLLVERLKFIDFVYCTVLEVKVIDGLGTTIDVVLTGGALHEADTIVVCGLDGPIIYPP